MISIKYEGETKKFDLADHGAARPVGGFKEKSEAGFDIASGLYFFSKGAACPADSTQLAFTGARVYIAVVDGATSIIPAGANTHGSGHNSSSDATGSHNHSVPSQNTSNNPFCTNDYFTTVPFGIAAFCPHFHVTGGGTTNSTGSHSHSVNVASANHEPARVALLLCKKN